VCFELIAELGEDRVFRLLDLGKKLSAGSEANIRESFTGSAILYRLLNGIHIFHG